MRRYSSFEQYKIVKTDFLKLQSEEHKNEDEN